MSTSQYPISGTCPASVWAEERGTGEDVSAPATVATAAHVVTTYSTATMLKEILEAARPLLRNRPEYFFGQYDMEKEDWTDTMEAVNELYDNYRHDDYMDSQSDEDGDW
ncbi:hypothetical protein AGDE_13614 [Angomonas deanei]|nr:hypothetical protein AGDE_13614 [Angomonas deanei]|eukprot:EPY22027.1 hypothetical protein AGDE_13614 [Angomonas deanei]